MANLTPYLFSKDAKAQAEFYVQALGGEISVMTTYAQVPDTPAELKDKVIHLDMRVAGARLYMSDMISGEASWGSAVSLSLELPTESDAREAFARLAEGGVVRYPLEPAYWGSLHGQVEDKFGVVWMVTNEAPAAQA